ALAVGHHHLDLDELDADLLGEDGAVVRRGRGAVLRCHGSRAGGQAAEENRGELRPAHQPRVTLASARRPMTSPPKLSQCSSSKRLAMLRPRPTCSWTCQLATMSSTV